MTPCNNCPWRKDAPVEHWDAEHFRDIWTSCQDDGMAIMLCHKAAKLPEDQRGKMPCAGWIKVMGTDAIGVRLLLATGKIKREDLDKGENCPELYNTFQEMMEANGVQTPDRNKHHRGE